MPLQAYNLPMRISLGFVCVTLLSSCVIAAHARASQGARVKGVVTDIANSRVTKATVTVEDANGQKLRDQTAPDGTYSIELKPGTYTISVRSTGFCGVRRAAFVVQKHSEIQFDFQLWACPSDDVGSYEYKELDQVPHTHLKTARVVWRESN